MATTTNYSWTTPDDTALVKDGAAAIRTLGSSADTTVKALNPGTTSGDLDYYTSSTAKARIAIGTNGQVLTSNGTVPSWATPSSGGMTLINTGGTTLTGASVTISSIPATYNNLMVIVRNYRPATDTAALAMRFNGDGASSRHRSQDALQENNVAFNSESVRITGESDNGASNSLSATTIYDYANTSTFKISQTHASIVPNATTPANINVRVIQGYYNQTTAISSLVFFNDAGGNFTSGTVFVYGVK